MIKLIISRFAEKGVNIASANVDITGDNSDLLKKVDEGKTAIKDLANSTPTELKKMANSFASIEPGKGLKNVRKELVGSINLALNDAKKLMSSANASDKFKLRMQTEMDKFATQTQTTDFRANPRVTDINKLLTQQERINKLVSQETISQEKVQAENDKIAEQLKKQRELATAVALGYDKMGQSSEVVTKTLQKDVTAFSDFKNGLKAIENLSSNSSLNFRAMLHHLTGAAVTVRILGGTIRGIIGIFANLYDTAASYEEAMNLYRTALGDFAQEADVWAKRISTALYLDPKDVMQYTGALYSLVQGLGASDEAAYKMSTNLTQLAYDMSSYLNIDVQSAYDKLQSAITGQSRAVASAGIALQQASLQELAYTMGIDKKVATMTQAEKTYLRYIQIMNSTKNMQGDLAKTILTPENALRTIRAQFTLFARALGQVVIPIVLKAIPYIMALTRMLTALANKLGELVGYKPTDINYDSFKGVNKGLKTTSVNLDGVGKSAKAARDEINRTLAPFDELNVVESESKTGGAGGGGGIGGAGSDLMPDLEKYIDGYDMLAKLTKTFEDQVDDAEKKLKSFGKILKAVGVAFATWKLFKTISNIGKMANAMRLAISEGTGLGSIVQALALRFSDGFRYAKYFGVDGLGAINSGFANMLGPIGLVIAQVGLFGTALVGSFSITRQWDGEIDSLGKRLVGAGGLTAALATVGALIGGPFTAGAIAVAGMTGALSGLIASYYELLEEEEWQRNYDNLFDGQGISLNRLTGDLDRAFESLTTFNAKMDETNTAVTDAKTKLDEAQQGVLNLQATLEANTFEENAKQVGNIRTAYELLRDAVIDADQKEQARQIAMLDRLLQEGRISKTTYDQEVQQLNNLTNLRSAQARGYYKELADLQSQLSTGKITQDEYNEKVAALASDYSLVSTNSDTLRLNMLGLYDVAKEGFDLENPEKMNKSIKDLKEKYDNLKTSTETTYKSTHELNLQKLSDYDDELAVMKRNGQEGTKEFNAVRDARNNLWNTDLELTRSYNEQMNTIGATYKDVMLTFLAQIDSESDLTNKNVKGTVKEIEGALGDLKKFDVTDSVSGLFSNYSREFESQGGTFSTKAKTLFSTYASEIGTKFSGDLASSVKRETDKTSRDLETSVSATYGKLGDKIGRSTTEGVGKGITSTTDKEVLGPISKMGTDMENTASKKLEINSPSHVFQRIGNSITEGTAKGITDKSDDVSRAVENMANKAIKQMNGKELKLNINTSVEKSFNSILSKLQTFCNKWRSAVNDLMSGMKSSMNGIKVSKDGKITYTSMPSIKVGKFAEGGFPTKGDLFFANENGIPEYITTIGNRTAVANQDQMATAVSNAILTAMSGYTQQLTKEPSTIIVQIGNDKVYEGHGTYQNRQSDRYGTTYVKI